MTLRDVLASMVLAGLLVACGGGSDVAIGDDAAAAVAVAPPASSPLEAKLRFASEPGRRQYQLITMQREADTTIVQCMKQAGFFYATAPAEDAFRSGAFVGDGSLEWTTANGLGITSSFIDALAADAATQSPDAATTNLDYVASLTSEQATAYDKALVGELLAAETSTTEYQPAGCWGRAFTDLVRLLSIIDEFQPQLDALNSRLDADPRVTGFRQTWSTCMDAQGYRYQNERAMVDHVYAQLLEVELIESNGVTQVASLDALDELAAYEREVAIASFDCERGFADDLASLRNDYEQEFLDDNRFRIAELIAPPTGDDN